MKILIVEDNLINSRLMVMGLELLPIQCDFSVAEDADTAIDMTSRNLYDLVLMDINLGNGRLDGTDIVKMLRKTDRYKDVSIFAVTCYSLPGDKEQFIAAGFDEYYAKPVNMDLLSESIMKLYDQKNPK
ncbi:MAG: response regulator [Bacteroidota bacterium]